jgi:glutamine---fructose-6-phosphate transaminase (isomerizing)
MSTFSNMPVVVPATAYLDNILEQPTVVRSLLTTYQQSTVWAELGDRWLPFQVQSIVLTGMGGSYSALWPLWYELTQQGHVVQLLEPSEILHYCPTLLERSRLWIIVSQSGESVEIQRLVERIQDRRDRHQPCPMVISVSTSPGNTLAQGSDLALFTNAGTEVGVATKTFTGTMALLFLVGHCLLGTLTADCYGVLGAIADYQQGLLEECDRWLPSAVAQLRGARSYALIGRGPSLATVQDGALVFKEVLRQPAEGFSGGQFRHGPMELVNSGLGAIVVRGVGTSQDLSLKLERDLVERGARVVAIGPTV